MPSNSIYTSDKILPYVYILTHKTTNQFYIGSRANKLQTLPSHLDILNYQSSSKEVSSMGFENFEILIVAEFFNGKDAYDFEQKLIYENFNHELILNKHHRYQSEGRFNFTGHHHTTEARHNISKKNTGIPKPIGFSDKLRQRNLGKTVSDSTRNNMSTAQKKRTLNKYNGIKAMNALNIKQTLYQIYNVKTNEYYIGRKYDILKNIGKNLRTLLEGNSLKSHNGWIVIREVPYPNLNEEG